MAAKKMHRHFLSLIMALLPCSLLLCQQMPSSVAISYPEVAREFQKYQDYPVSPATGVPNISIPLFDFKVNNYTIPFALNYHASGIKVTQDQGSVGCGWSLTPSFRITRVIHNRPDEKYLLNTDEIKTADDVINEFQYIDVNNMTRVNENVMYLANIAQQYPLVSDTEYDIFTIQLPTCSGSFILQKNNDVFQVVKINSNALKITPTLSVGGNLDHFDVVDENGILYKFGYYSQEIPFADRMNYFEYTTSPGENYVSSWMLHEIILPSSEEIVFTYKNMQILTANFFWNKDSGDG